jgi:hypothetical protein
MPPPIEWPSSTTLAATARLLRDELRDALALRDEAVIRVGPAFGFAPARQVRNQQAVLAAQAFGERIPVLLAAGEAVQHHQDRRALGRAVGEGVDPAVAGDDGLAVGEAGDHALPLEMRPHQQVRVVGEYRAHPQHGGHCDRRDFSASPHQLVIAAWQALPRPASSLPRSHLRPNRW